MTGAACTHTAPREDTHERRAETREYRRVEAWGPGQAKDPSLTWRRTTISKPRSSMTLRNAWMYLLSWALDVNLMLPSDAVTHELRFCTVVGDEVWS